MLVSVSTMPAGELENIKKYVKEIESFVDFLHCDICDGIYNNAKCFLPEYLKEISSMTTLPLDCHLMTKNVLQNAKKYIDFGANIVTAQFESFENENEVLQFIKYSKSKKVLVGLAVEPETKIDKILPYIDKLDIVLVMSVKTGASGQKFNQNVVEKIKFLSNLKAEKNHNFLIEVDGGITDKTAKIVRDFGADIVVSGNFVYTSKNRFDVIEKLKIL